MLKKTIISTLIISIVLFLSIIAISNSRGILFHEFPWLIPTALACGILTGIIRGILYDRVVKKMKQQPDRHTIDSFLEHWGTGVGIIVLMVSGFLIKADYNRFFLLNLHFIGLIITLYFGTYFLVHSLVTKKLKNLIPDFSDIIKGTFKKYIMGAKWTDKGKYLSSQKSAFLVFALLGAGIIVTGSIKTVAYYWGVPFKVTQIVTQSHDIIAGLFVLMLVVHIIFVVSIPSHRRLLKSLFTGNFK